MTPDTDGATGDARGEVDRRSVLKLIGGSAVALGATTGTASAHSSQFFGCDRVCTDTDGDFAVVSTEDGYEARRPEAAPWRADDVIWDHENTFCYEASDGESIVAFIEEDEYRGDSRPEHGCTLCINPNACAEDHHGGAREIIAEIDGSTIGPCFGDLEVGYCEAYDADGSKRFVKPAPDVPVLNYALALEHLELALYREGLSAFGDEELRTAETLSTFGETFRAEVPTKLRTMAAHQERHVEVLADAVERLRGTPANAGEYDFRFETPSAFLETALLLEETGVDAYGWMETFLVDGGVLETVASLRSVEARHASYLRLLADDVPFPNALGEDAGVNDVLGTAARFVTGGVDPSRYRLRGWRPTADRVTDDAHDSTVLNDALALQRLEAALYREGLIAFDDDELRAADVVADADEYVRAVLPEYLRTIGRQESDHASALAEAVERVGASPVAARSYDFGFDSPSAFLELAATVETTAVGASAAAATSVSDDEAFSTLLGIRAVEARHAAFLDQIRADSPFRNALGRVSSAAAGRELVDEHTER